MLNAAVPPVFLSTSPQVDVVINSSDTVTLKCSAQGYPLSSLHWRKDGMVVYPDRTHISLNIFRRQNPMDLYTFSSVDDGPFQPIPPEGLEYYEVVSELTLMPPLLRTDTANYTCVVGAVFVQGYNRTSDSISVYILGESCTYDNND